MRHKPSQPVVTAVIQHGSVIKVSLFVFIHQISKFVVNVMPRSELTEDIIVLLFFMIYCDTVLLSYIVLII